MAGEFDYLRPDPAFDYTQSYCDVMAQDVEEALQFAEGALNRPRERMEYRVVREARKRTLGFFGKEWSMVVRVWVPGSATAAEKAVKSGAKDAGRKANGDGSKPARERKPVSPEEANEVARRAQAYVKDILAAMGEDVAVGAHAEGDGVTVTLDGERLGFIIGRRGDTLDALQYLTGLASNRSGSDGYCRVTIDIENYREKREQSLTGLAKKMSAQVLRTGRRVSLEAMNPYERRIIHTAVQSISGVTSWSVGSDDARHVVIGPGENKGGGTGTRSEGDRKGKNKRQTRGRGRSGPGGGGNNSGGSGHSGSSGSGGHSGSGSSGGERRPTRVGPDGPLKDQPREIRKFVPRSDPLPVADGATPPEKTDSEKERSATLYGRIDL